MKNQQLLKLSLIILLFLTIQSYSQAPSWQWINAGGSGGYSQNYQINTQEIRTDNKGNIYGISNLFNYTTHVDTVNLVNGFGYEDFCVYSYRCDGSFRWVRFFGDIGADYPSGLVVDAQGNVFVGGQVGMSGTGPSHYGDSTVNPSFPIIHKNTFVAKLDSSGHTVWLTIADSTNDNVWEWPVGLETDNQGNLLQMIKFNGATKFGGFNIPQAGVYMVKYNKNNGAVMSVFKIQYQPRSFNRNYVRFSIDSDNSIYLYSDVGDTIVMGNQIVSVNTDSIEFNSILAKLDANGQKVWVKEIKGYYQSDTSSSYKRIGGKPLIVGNYIYVYGETQSFPNSTFFSYSVSNPYINFPANYTKLIARFNKQTGAFISAINLRNKDYMPSYMTLGIRNNKILVSSSSGFMVINQSDTIIPQVSPMTTMYPFIAEVDTALTHFNWGKSTTANGTSFAYSMTTDKLGNVYLGGSAKGYIKNSSGTITAVQDASEFFWVAKIATTNTNCICDVSKPYPQKISLVNKVLTVKGNTSAAVDSVYWLWGDGDSTLYTSLNTNISHTYQNGGNYTVCMHAYNFYGMEDSCIQINSVEIDQEDFVKREIQVFPNPANSNLTIHFSENQSLPAGIVQLYSSQGKLIQEQFIQSNVSNFQLDVKNLEPGFYIGILKSEKGESWSFKFVKE